MSQLIVRHRRHLILLCVMIAFIMVTTRADASYRIASPMHPSYGHIRQNYLYGIVDNGPSHKAVDYTVPMDTYFYAVADGIIMQVQESYENTCEPGGQPPFQCPAFGNLILIRHYQRHYNRTTGTMDNVYSLYAHLSKDSIPFNVGTSVNAGQIVGRTDDTGNSSGPHLHFQIMIDPDPNRTVTYPLNWTESSSRNPELWLNPYNGNTGTVIGKVTTTSGADIAGALIYGLPKEPGWVPAYLSSQTYNDAALKPDDILMENWGTTDVTPGRYQITTNLGGDLGWHTVVAGQVTYAGLYPVWLPYVRNNTYGWHSSVIVQNTSSTYHAQVNTTFFNPSGSVFLQHQDFVPPRGQISLTPSSGFDGSAVVVSSEDVAVVVREENGSELNEYNGITAATSEASLGWEKAGSTVYVPIVKKTYNNRTSRLFVMNAGTKPTIAYLRYYDSSGNPYGSQLSRLLTVNGSDYFDPSAYALCSAVVWTTDGQPLAVAVREQEDVSTNNRSTFNAFSAGATTNFLPLIKKNHNNLWSGVAVQNLGVPETTVRLMCYPSTGGDPVACGAPTTVQSKATAVFTLVGGADSYYGSAVATSTGQPIATVIYENGTPYKLITNAVLNGPSTTAYAPELYRDYPQSGQTWNSGISIQNMGTNATVTVVYYSQAGGSPVNQWSMSLGANQSWFINKWTTYMPPAPFVGSAVIQSTQPIAVMVDAQHTGSGDTRASYTAPNR